MELDGTEGQKPCQSDQFFGNLAGLQNGVDFSRFDGSQRHAIVSGGFGCLNEHRSANGLDGAEPLDSISSRSGQNHSDRPLLQFTGKGPQQEIDGCELGPIRGPRLQS